MKKITLIVLISILCINIFAQMPQGRGGKGMGDMTPEGEITGKVVDLNSKMPVDYAQLVLKRLKDSSVVSGTITNEKGIFIMKDLPYGKFYLEINFIGFKKKTMPDILITPKQKQLNIGTVEISPSVNQLKEVEVTAERSMVEYKLDKKVINVGKDLSAAGGNAVDVLQNTPSVKTDQDGNVSMRGTSSFTVLIDGKPSLLEGTEALQQIPASSIESIEIITNPSAKYEPDGISGIINVVMKKNKQSGLSALLNANANNYGGYGADISVNLRKNKFNWMIGANYNTSINPGYSNSFRESQRDSIKFISINSGERGRGHFGNGIKGGFEYNINSKNMFMINAGYSEGGFKRYSKTKYSDFQEYQYIKIYENFYSRESNMEMNRKNTQVTSFYQKDFEKKGHNVSAAVTYEYSTGLSPQTNDQIYTDSLFNIINNIQSTKDKSEIDVKKLNYKIKADYVLPINENSVFEAGYNGRILDGAYDYRFEFFNNSTSSWKWDSTQSNNMIMKTQIHALYTTYTNVWLGINYKLGLRGEYTLQNIEQTTTGKKYPINRLDYFPTIHFSRQFASDQQLQLGYSRRIERPNERDLNPFPIRENDYNIRMGNPDLKPEYVDSYELNYQKKFGMGAFISAGLFYRQNNNKISDVSYYLNDTSQIMVNQHKNMDKDYATGIETSIGLDMIKNLNITFGGSAYKYRIEGNSYGETITKETNSWSANTNISYKLKYGTRFQLNGFYESPEVSLQETESGMYIFSLSVRQEFFDRALSVTLNARDILNSMKHASTIKMEGLYQYSEFTSKGTSFSLAISYRLNNFKKKAKIIDEDSGGGEDM